MLSVGMPRRQWLPNLRPDHRRGGNGQVRVKGRRQGNVCGLDKVNLVTKAWGEPLVGTPTGG